MKLVNHFKRKLNKKKLDHHTDPDGLRIHIGCGDSDIPGWVNIDARGFRHVHLCTDDLSLAQFADRSLSKIYLCHVLEHFDFNDSKKLLELFFLKLKSRGEVIISVPDFELVCDGYLRSSKKLSIFRHALMGGQDYPHNYHKSVYDFRTLEEQLNQCGYAGVQRWFPSREGIGETDWAARKLRSGLNFYEISLNLKGYKP